MSDVPSASTEGSVHAEHDSRHVWFLEHLDSVNRAIQGSTDLRQMLRAVLDSVLGIFRCDRAWLFFPCDPDAASFRVPMEVTTPDYPGAGVLDIDLPLPPDMAANLREALESERPVTYVVGTERPVNEVSATRFGVQSMMLCAIHPKVGKPWAFGLHHCSRPRVWTPEEGRLFLEIGRRLADGLTTLLAHRELLESEAKYHRIVDTAAEGIWVLDSDTHTAFANASMAGMLGYTPEEMVGRPGTDFMFEEDAREHEKAMEGRRQGLSETYERRFRRKDGREVWTRAAATSIVDPDRGFQGSFAMFTDITERRRAEKELARVNRALRMLSNSNQILIRATDEVKLLEEVCGVVVEVGGYRMAWVGYAENDEGKTVRPVAVAGFDSEYIRGASISWDESSERGRGPAGKAIRSGEVVYVQDFASDEQMAPWRMAALQRGYRSGIALPLRGEDGRAFGVLLIYSAEVGAITRDEIELMAELSHDLAYGIDALRTREEYRRTTEALRSREAYIRDILDSVDEGFIVVDRDYRILSANRAFCEMTGSSPGFAIGRQCYDVAHGSGTACFDNGKDCPVRHTYSTGSPHTAIHEHRTSLGATRTIEVKSYPMTDAAGAVVSVIETLNDLTEKKRLEERLAQAQKMEAVGQLAGGVAHDFNNMLGVILGRAELALDVVEATHPARADLAEILATAGRSAELTRQLLAFARKQPVAPRVLDLNETVEGMLKMLRRMIGEDIEIFWSPGPRLWTVKMDPVQIDQILANLCVNARDAIAGVGRITIETRTAVLADSGEVERLGGAPGEFVLLAVTDNGCGMDPSTLRRLFEPFFTTKEVGQGTGLGLATVYGIVKQNNGYIDVSSQPGEGSTFTIYLPRHMKETGAKDDARAVAPIARGHETILLVEDEPAHLETTRRILERCGYVVLVASSPADALEVAGEHAGDLDLLLTDVVMPGMNGLDLAKRVSEVQPGIRCLFMSGYADDVMARHGIADTTIDFVSKPFSARGLASKIREVLGRA